MTKIRVWLRICLYSIESAFDLRLGDYVRMNGKRYMLMNGPCRPSWSIQEVGGEEKRLEQVDEKLFVKELSIRNIWHDIGFTYNFYMGYWYDIWVRDPNTMRKY